MSLETEIPEVLFTEMKDFIESSSNLGRKEFINSFLSDFLFQNGCQVKLLRESYWKYLLNHSPEL